MSAGRNMAPSSFAPQKGGRAFAAAWDSALDLARDRELARLHDNLGELARKTEEANAEARAAGRLVPPGEEDDGEDSDLRNRAEEARASIFAKLQKMRFNSLREEIVPDPAKRAAWITLYGPEEVEAVENGTWECFSWEEANARSNAAANPVSPDEGEGESAEQTGKRGQANCAEAGDSSSPSAMTGPALSAQQCRMPGIEPVSSAKQSSPPSPTPPETSGPRVRSL